jgi:hypothetical protein
MLNEFKKIIESIALVYYDSATGYYHNKNIVEKDIPTEYAGNYEFKKEYLKSKTVFYGHQPPPNHFLKCSQIDFRDRNDKNGENHKIISISCVVLIYSYWEYYRKRLMKKFNIEKLECEIMGDLRLIRHSIIHNKRRSEYKINDYKVFKWFNKGEEINIDKKKFEEIIKEVLILINSLKDKYENSR